MSDVKKLIAEARGYQGQDEYGLVDLAHRLADALEARVSGGDRERIGDATVLGPDCILSADGNVIAYKGENFRRSPAPPVSDDTEWEYTVGYVNYDGQVLPEDEDETTIDIDEAREWVQEALDSGQFSNAIVVGKPVGSPWVAIEKGGESNG